MIVPSSLMVLGSSLTALGVLRDARRLGLACVVFDNARGIATSSRYAVAVIPSEQSPAALLAKLLHLGDKKRALIATEDRWLEFVLVHRAPIEAAYGVLLLPSNPALRICLDKLAFARWCADNGFPAARSWPLDSVDGVRLPALIRPARTLHHRPELAPKAVFVDSLHELDRWAGRFKAAGVEALVSESLLDSNPVQYSVPFARRDGTTVSFVARKLRPPAAWARTGTYVELSPDTEVERLARAAVDALDYFGIGEVEVLRLQDGRCYLVEINARPWMQYSLAAASGHPLLAFLLGRLAAPQGRKEDVRWISFRADLYVCFSRSEGLIPHGRLTLFQYCVSLLKANAFACFDLRDPWPAMKELAALAGQLLRSAMRRWIPGVAKQEKPA